MKKVCPICNEEFETNSHLKRYCSDACKQESAKKRWRAKYKKKYKPIKCGVCGKKFTPISSKNKYCSKFCLKESTAIKAKCAVCGKNFKKYKSSDARTCSPECGQRYKKRITTALIPMEFAKESNAIKSIYLVNGYDAAREAKEIGVENFRRKYFWRLSGRASETNMNIDNMQGGIL